MHSNSKDVTEKINMYNTDKLELKRMSEYIDKKVVRIKNSMRILKIKEYLLRKDMQMYRQIHEPDKVCELSDELYTLFEQIDRKSRQIEIFESFVEECKSEIIMINTYIENLRKSKNKTIIGESSIKNML